MQIIGLACCQEVKLLAVTTSVTVSAAATVVWGKEGKENSSDCIFCPSLPLPP